MTGYTLYSWKPNTKMKLLARNLTTENAAAIILTRNGRREFELFGFNGGWQVLIEVKDMVTERRDGGENYSATIPQKAFIPLVSLRISQQHEQEAAWPELAAEVVEQSLDCPIHMDGFNNPEITMLVTDDTWNQMMCADHQALKVSCA